MATDRVLEHIDRLREKPEHIRHRIAFGVAFGISGLVAVTWMTAMATSGTLALKSNTTVADNGERNPAETLAESGTAFSNLMGAAGAAFGATSSDPSLGIIEGETRTSSTFGNEEPSANATDKTVISF